ncbi:MAG: hypothetical protein MUO91_05040 [candidate division Zixibacteria bacterium]|nr:hypothetical protein [candidate division Zixibacteria bacterium]
MEHPLGAEERNKPNFVAVPKDPGSKYDNALKLGVKTINEEEFKKLIGR